LNIRHIRTQISTPWTNGKIEAFWEVLQSEVLDRRWFTSLPEAENAMRSFADYYNFHRLVAPAFHSLTAPLRTFQRLNTSSRGWTL
jgi:transposase InsO family protein